MLFLQKKKSKLKSFSAGKPEGQKAGKLIGMHTFKPYSFQASQLASPFSAFVSNITFKSRP
jgi:hypothetical protein